MGSNNSLLDTSPLARDKVGEETQQSERKNDPNPLNVKEPEKRQTYFDKLRDLEFQYVSLPKFVTRRKRSDWSPLWDEHPDVRNRSFSPSNIAHSFHMFGFAKIEKLLNFVLKIVPFVDQFSLRIEL